VKFQKQERNAQENNNNVKISIKEAYSHFTDIGGEHYSYNGCEECEKEHTDWVGLANLSGY
jgi:hypothetical protein